MISTFFAHGFDAFPVPVLITPLFDRMADIRHQMIVKPEIMQHTQTQSQNLAGFEQVTDIGTGVSTAGRAPALLFDGTTVQLKSRIQEIQSAV